MSISYPIMNGKQADNSIILHGSANSASQQPLQGSWGSKYQKSFIPWHESEILRISIIRRLKNLKIHQLVNHIFNSKSKECNKKKGQKHDYLQKLLKLEKFSNRDDTQEKAYTEESITILYFYSLRSLLVISQKGLNVLNGPEYVGLVRTQVSDSSNPERSWNRKCNPSNYPFARPNWNL